jgi:hypothetical protein
MSITVVIKEFKKEQDAVAAERDAILRTLSEVVSDTRPAARVLLRYHECPACRVETTCPDLCLDCLEGLDLLESTGEKFKLADVAPLPEPKKLTNWKTLAICIILVPLFVEVALPMLIYACQCIHLWTGLPWP